MALLHKGLDVETIPWRFTEKDMIAFSGQEHVPVLVDGDTVVSDSFAIALHLEETYPDRPSLFGGSAGLSLARFVNVFADNLGRRLIKPQPQSDGGDFCESQEGGGLSVVSGGDVAELLELVDASLDEIALPVFAP